MSEQVGGPVMEVTKEFTKREFYMHGIYILRPIHPQLFTRYPLRPVQNENAKSWNKVM